MKKAKMSIFKSSELIQSIYLPFQIFIIILLIQTNLIYASDEESLSRFSISRFSISGGVSFNWTLHNDKLDRTNQPDWLYEGNTGKYLSIGYSYNIEETGAYIFVMTIEKFKSNFQYWDRTTVGTLDATFIRLDPLVMQSNRPGFNVSLNFVGVILMTGKIDVLEGYNLYYPDGNNLYRVRDIKLKPTLGFSFLGMGLSYKFPKTKIHIGIETSLYELMGPKVSFETTGGKFEDKTISLFGFCPVRLRVIFNL